MGEYINTHDSRKKDLDMAKLIQEATFEAGKACKIQSPSDAMYWSILQSVYQTQQDGHVEVHPMETKTHIYGMGYPINTTYSVRKHGYEGPYVKMNNLSDYVRSEEVNFTDRKIERF